MTDLTEKQIRALAFNAIGRGAETKIYSPYRLEWAGRNSGLSIGFMQWDFSQRLSSSSIGNLFRLYNAWADTTNTDKFLTELELMSFLSQKGVDAKLAKDGDIARNLNQFFDANVGREYISRLEDASFYGAPKVDGLLPFADRVQSSSFFRNLNEADSRIVLAGLLDIFNRSPSTARSVLPRLQNSALTMEDFYSGIIDGLGGDFPKHANVAMSTAKLINRLESDGTFIGAAWRSLADQAMRGDPTVDTQVLDLMMRDTEAGHLLLDRLANPTPGRTVILLGGVGTGRSIWTIAPVVAVDKDGNLRVQGGDGSGFVRNRDMSGWTPTQSNDPNSSNYRSNLYKENGIWKLRMSDGSSFDIGGASVAIVNINGIDITLDAEENQEYAFNRSGDLVKYAAIDSFSINATLMTGPNKGSSVALSFDVAQSGAMWSVFLGGLTSGFAPPDLNDLAYSLVSTSASTGIVSHQLVTPVRDEGGNVVGQRQVISETLGDLKLTETTTTSVRDANGQTTQTVETIRFGGDNLVVSHTSSTSTRDASGLIVGSVDVTFDSSGAVTGTVAMGRNADGSTTTVARDHQGVIQYSENRQIFDDGSTLKQTTYPAGRIDTIATDANGQPSSLVVSEPTADHRQVTTTYTYVTVTGSTTPQAVATSQSVVQTFDDGSRLEERTVYGLGSPLVTRITYDVNGQMVSSEPVLPATSAPQDNLANTTAVVNAINGVIGAIQGRKPISIATNGFNFVYAVANPETRQNLGSANVVVQGVGSLYGMYNAFQPGGSALSRASALGSSLNYVNTQWGTQLFGTAGSEGLSHILNGTEGTVFNGARDGLVNNGQLGLANGGVPGALPVISLVMSIKNKDPIGTVSGLISVINPAWMTPGVGWALAVGSLVFSLTRSAPDAWGVASVRFADGEDNLNIDVAAEGESFGKDKARQTQQTLVDALKDQIDGQNQLIKLGLAQGGANAASYDDAALGLIAQRLPTLSWRANNLSDRGFTIVDIDALSDSQRYPYRRFDDDGVPFSADPAAWQPNPTEAGQSPNMPGAMVRSAVDRGALAPLWEVRTANLQAQARAVDAGLSEAERAAKAGRLAGLDTAYANAHSGDAGAKNKRSGHFMPVALDLDGDGQPKAGSRAKSDLSPHGYCVGRYEIGSNFSSFSALTRPEATNDFAWGKLA